MSEILSTIHGESSLWLPPKRMRQYAIARMVGGLLFAAIFAGWMAIQWSNVVMRFTGGALIVLTAWVTATSIVTDARRMRGRQVECDGESLTVTTPDSASPVPLNAIGGCKWSEAPDAYGLSFYDHNNKLMAHLDENIIADEAEARAFLRWLRTRTAATIEVIWK